MGAAATGDRCSASKRLRLLAPVLDDQESAGVSRVIGLRKLFPPDPHLSAAHAP
jgi:hypothetical protein